MYHFFFKYITCIPSVHTCIWWKGNWYLLHFPYKLLFIPHIRSLTIVLDKVRAGSTIICTLFECACDVRQQGTVFSRYCEYNWKIVSKCVNFGRKSTQRTLLHLYKVNDCFNLVYLNRIYFKKKTNTFLANLINSFSIRIISFLNCLHPHLI